MLAGWGGSLALNGGRLNSAVKGGATGRLLVYALDADGEPPPGVAPPVMPRPPRNTALDSDIRAGFDSYARNCSVCHGMNAVGGGVIPDLRYLGPEKHRIFRRIVHDGILADNGMPGFSHRLTPEQVDQVQAYVIYEANREWRRRDDAGWWRAIKDGVSEATAWLLLKLQ